MSITIILCIGLIKSSVDITEPSHRKGRLVPYAKNGNAVVRVVVDRGVPYLCIFTTTHISTNEQVVIADVSC